MSPSDFDLGFVGDRSKLTGEELDALDKEELNSLAGSRDRVANRPLGQQTPGPSPYADMDF